MLYLSVAVLGLFGGVVGAWSGGEAGTVQAGVLQTSRARAARNTLTRRGDGGPESCRSCTAMLLLLLRSEAVAGPSPNARPAAAAAWPLARCCCCASRFWLTQMTS